MPCICTMKPQVHISRDYLEVTMMKELFVEPRLDVILFSEGDILTGSGGQEPNEGEDDPIP